MVFFAELFDVGILLFSEQLDVLFTNDGHCQRNRSFV